MAIQPPLPQNNHSPKGECVGKQVLDDALHTGGDIGCVAILKQYERQQIASNSVMMAALDGKSPHHSSHVPFAPLPTHLESREWLGKVN